MNAGNSLSDSTSLFWKLHFWLKCLSLLSNPAINYYAFRALSCLQGIISLQSIIMPSGDRSPKNIKKKTLFNVNSLPLCCLEVRKFEGNRTNSFKTPSRSPSISVLRSTLFLPYWRADGGEGLSEFIHGGFWIAFVFLLVISLIFSNNVPYLNFNQITLIRVGALWYPAVNVRDLTLWDQDEVP